MNKGILPKLENAFLTKENQVQKVVLLHENKLQNQINVKMKELKLKYSPEALLSNATELLKKIIAKPSLSTDEYNVSLVIEGFFHRHQIRPSV
ncbi:hypothetical protein RCH13_000156 [Chryseobacterium sp. MP_3.2]|nr:hypothetical protein [Chryseobacterium sp. MP_3.2]